VEVDGRHRVTAHVGAGAGKNFVRLVVGDQVVVALTQQDLTRGRIIERR
jgi:translation initiation factor IF-1